MKSRTITFGMLFCFGWFAIDANADTSPPSGTPTPCNAGVCKISVMVSGSPGHCTASVDKPYVSIDSARNLQWTIATQGYSFAANGIAFSDAQFEPKHVSGRDKFIVHDKHSSSGDFAYAVNVEGCATLDPYIRN